MGPTPTPTRTLGIRLSCNFVNVYTIVYHVQYTRTRVHSHIPNGHPREEKRLRTKVRGQVGELNGPRAPRQADCADFRDPRAEVGEEVGVDVRVGRLLSVPWNLSLTTHCSSAERITTQNS